MHLITSVCQWVRYRCGVGRHALTRSIFLCTIEVVAKHLHNTTYHALTRDRASDRLDIGVVDDDFLCATGETRREVGLAVVATHRLVDIRRAVALGIARVSQIDD